MPRVQRAIATKTKAKTLTAITVLAAGAAGYAAGVLLLSQTTLTSAEHERIEQMCLASCRSEAQCKQHTDVAGLLACEQGESACVSSCQRSSEAQLLTASSAESLSLKAQPPFGTAYIYSTEVGAVVNKRLTLGDSKEYVWVLRGTLPAGLSFDSKGSLTGTPSMSEDRVVTLDAMEPGTQNLAFSREFRIIVQGTSPSNDPVVSMVSFGALRVVTTGNDIPDGRVGVPYTLQLRAQGGLFPSGDNPQYYWVRTYGKFAEGLTFDSVRGVLEGTPVQSGTFTVGLVVVPYHGAPPTEADIAAGVAYTLVTTVAPATAPVAPLRITTETLPDATAGRVYQVALSAEGGRTPYQFRSTSARFPVPGLQLSSSGAITGTPTAPGTYNVSISLQAGAGDAEAQTVNKVYSIRVVAGTSPLAINTSLLPDGQVGVDYTANLQASGGAGSYVWSSTSASRPGGLTLSASGALSGRPTQSGTYTMRVTVRDGDGSAVASQQERDVVINIRPATTQTTQTQTQAQTQPQGTSAATTQGARLTFEDVGSYPSGFVGVYYNARPFEVSGGRPPYGYRITSGVLPHGLTLDPSRGAIAGTPTRAESESFILEVRDADGATLRAERRVTVRDAAERVTYVDRVVDRPVAVSTPAPTIVTTTTTNPGLAERLAILQRLGLRPHDLIKIPSDNDSRTGHDTTVWYIGTDGYRHFFPNQNVYFTWFSDFTRVRIVGANELAEIAMGPSVTYRPGARLVKFSNSSKVYAVDTGRRLRWVRNETVAREIYGQNWSRMVQDLSDAFFTDYRVEPGEIQGIIDYSPSRASNSVAYPSDVLPQ